MDPLVYIYHGEFPSSARLCQRETPKHFDFSIARSFQLLLKCYDTTTTTNGDKLISSPGRTRRTEWRMCLGTATTNNWNRAAVTQTKHLSFRTPIIRSPCPVMSRFLFGFYTTAFGRWLCGVDGTQCFDNPISNGIWPKSICTNFPHRGEERIIPVGWTTSTTRYEAVWIKGVSPEWCLFSENRIY